MSEIIDCPSPNHDERALPISVLVLHYTGMQDAEAAIARLTDPEGRVSSHYLVAEDGQLVRLVAEERRAWHAGKSFWRGITDVNSASIGIELANPGHEWGYRPFPEPQMDALLPLLADILDRHDIPRANVVGHSDVAPARKVDPGEYFDWERLGELGLALEIPAAKMNLFYDNPGAFYLAMERFGYDIIDGRAAVAAFQRRWRPSIVDGEIDGEIGGILFELLLERDIGRAR